MSPEDAWVAAGKPGKSEEAGLRNIRKRAKVAADKEAQGSVPPIGSRIKVWSPKKREYSTGDVTSHRSEFSLTFKREHVCFRVAYHNGQVKWHEPEKVTWLVDTDEQADTEGSDKEDEEGGGGGTTAAQDAAAGAATALQLAAVQQEPLLPSLPGQAPEVQPPQVEEEEETDAETDGDDDAEDEAKPKAKADDEGGSEGEDDEGEDDEGEDDEPIYEVEQILAQRTTRRTGVEYLIRWLGFDGSHDSWEPEENLLDLALLADWKRRQAEAQRRAAEEGLQSDAKSLRATSTGYKGVTFFPGSKPFQAKVTRGGRLVHLGNFATAKEAALAVARCPEEPPAAPAPDADEGAVVRQCVACGTTESPKWRCNSTLCNACGLRTDSNGKAKARRHTKASNPAAEAAAPPKLRIPEAPKEAPVQMTAEEAVRQAEAPPTPPPMTAQEALRQAEAKGLTLLRAERSAGYKGVTRNGSRSTPFMASVWRGGKNVGLGYFTTAEEAALTYARTPEAQAAVAAAAAPPAPPPMTAEEALRQAEAEGLTLHRAEGTSTGYKHVTLLTRPKAAPYRTQLNRGGEVMSFGSFATVEQAALQIARLLRQEETAAAAAAASPRTSKPAHAAKSPAEPPAESRPPRCDGGDGDGDGDSGGGGGGGGGGGSSNAGDTPLSQRKPARTKRSAPLPWELPATSSVGEAAEPKKRMKRAPAAVPPTATQAVAPQRAVEMEMEIVTEVEVVSEDGPMAPHESEVVTDVEVVTLDEPAMAASAGASTAGQPQWAAQMAPAEERPVAAAQQAPTWPWPRWRPPGAPAEPSGPSPSQLGVGWGGLASLL
tara:strand:- start:431 stop:2908 length:2478 start_codon:yes stop_codon:yes gene_type:complete